MIADDQYVVRWILNVYFSELGLLDRVMFCKDGVQVVDHFRRFLNEHAQSHGQLG